MHVKVLVLYCHPNHPASQLNRSLRAAAENVHGVTLHDLYHHYPHGFIDTEQEQELLQAHDVVVLQFPMYWYSTPPLLKAWQDEVLTFGFAYGQNRSLSPRQLLLAVSLGAHPNTYQRDKFAFELHELLRPLEAMSQYCGWEHRGIFSTGYEGNPSIEQLQVDAKRYQALLEDCVAGKLPPLFSTLNPSC